MLCRLFPQIFHFTHVNGSCVLHNIRRAAVELLLIDLNSIPYFTEKVFEKSFWGKKDFHFLLLIIFIYVSYNVTVAFSLSKVEIKDVVTMMKGKYFVAGWASITLSMRIVNRIFFNFCKYYHGFVFVWCELKAVFTCNASLSYDVSVVYVKIVVCAR